MKDRRHRLKPRGGSQVPIAPEVAWRGRVVSPLFLPAATRPSSRFYRRPATNARSDLRTIALARLPGLVRDAASDFQHLTGLTVVTTLGSASPNQQDVGLPSPLVHPLCAKSLRQIRRAGPCDAEWRKHLQSALRTNGPRIHTCPLGFRCAGVPLLLGEELLGLAKLVSGPEISKERFRSLVSLLEVVIARPCLELHVFLLKQEIETLQASVKRLRRVKGQAWSGADQAEGSWTNHENDDGSLGLQTLVSRVLVYLNEHHTDRMLSLRHVANAMGKNDKYLAHLFVQQVGMRMRTYVTVLRVRRACELLLQTSRTIEEVAHDSGFAHLVQFRQSFRRAVGVTASEYRQIFAGGASETSPDPSGPKSVHDDPAHPAAGSPAGEGTYERTAGGQCNLSDGHPTSQFLVPVGAKRNPLHRTGAGSFQPEPSP